MNLQEQIAHYKAVRERIANAPKRMKTQEPVKEPAPTIQKEPKPQTITFVDPIRAILKECAAAYDVTIDQMLGYDKNKKSMQARWQAMYLLHKRGLNFSRIGMIMKKDHTTVMNAVRKYEKSLAQGEAK